MFGLFLTEMLAVFGKITAKAFQDFLTSLTDFFNDGVFPHG
jgi:hypothetical protein